MGWKQIGIRLGGLGLALPRPQVQAQHQELAAQFLLYADALYHFLLTQSDAELAQDISQQSWLKLLELQQQQPEQHNTAANDSTATAVHPACFQQRSQFKTWLFALARNALFDELRRRQRWSTQELTEHCLLSDAADGQLQQLMLAEQQRTLQHAISLLPLLQKEALLLQLEGFSLDEIANISGSSTETVKSRLRYARASLSQALEHDDDNTK